MKTYITLFLLSFTSIVMAQDLQFGGNFSVGAGTINATGNQEQLNSLVTNEHCLKRFHVSTQTGMTFSGGGFAEYNISENLGIGIRANYVHTGLSIYTNYVHDAFSREIIESNHNLTIGYLSTPVYARYTFLPDLGLFASVGFGTNALINKSITTKEIRTTENYDQAGNLTGSTVGSETSNSARLNSPNAINTFAQIGVGMKLQNNIGISLEYMLPFTKNEFFSSDQNYTSATHESNIFTDAFRNNPDFNSADLNQMKFGSATLTLSYFF